MRNRREIIEEFSDFLNEEVTYSIEQNIPFEAIKNYRKILILQSAPIEIVEDLIRDICKVNLEAEFIVVGEDTCESLKKAFADRHIELISHNKVFNDEDIELVRVTISKYLVDSAIFFNNFVNSVDFSSVEHILAFIDKDVTIYSYSYIQKELNKHNDVPYHIYGCIVYKDLIEWFKQFS